VSYNGSASAVAGVLDTLTAQQREATTGPWAGTARTLIDNCILEVLHPGDPAPPQPPVTTVRPAVLRELLYIAEDAATRRLWQRHRIVYDLDPGLWAELGDTDRDTNLPDGLFASLPHPDPFIALPEPLVIPINSSEQQRIPGFFVHGRTSGAARTGGIGISTQCSTNDPLAVPGLVGLVIPGYIEDRAGRPRMADRSYQDMIINRVTLRPGTGHGITVGQMIDAIRGNFDVYQKEEPGHFDLSVAPAITRCVSALVYLCSVNRELAPLPARPTGRTRTPGVKPPKVIAVGYQIGAALRAWRRTEATGGQPTGRTVRPHVRRAHFHTFRVGPGRAGSIVKWLPPIPINVTADADTTTVVPVRSPR
jgi:hypothetical protein